MPPIFVFRSIMVGKELLELSPKMPIFACPNENSETTFIITTSPKNDGIAFGFKRLPLFEWILRQFLKIAYFNSARSSFPTMMDPKTKIGGIGSFININGSVALKIVFFGSQNLSAPLVICGTPKSKVGKKRDRLLKLLIVCRSIGS